MANWKERINQAIESKKYEEIRLSKKAEDLENAKRKVFETIISPALSECESYLVSIKSGNIFKNKDHNNPSIGVGSRENQEWSFTIENDGNPNRLKYSTIWGSRSTTGIIEPVTKDQILSELAESLNKVSNKDLLIEM
jgi:hypothetical protein